MTECVTRLITKPPPNYREAVTFFNYFASRLHELQLYHIVKLSESSIVPINNTRIENGFTAEKKVTKYIQPPQCYLGSSSKYGEIFDFVDFGDLANAFLLKCGSKHEPSSVELATLVSKEPARLLGVMKTPERYLSLLKTLAEDMTVLKRNRELWKQLKIANWLLASRDIPNKDGRKSLLDAESDDEEEPSSIKQFELAMPKQIVVVDDYNAFRIFRSSLICAPQDDVMEDFYLALGAGPLSSLVEEQLRLGVVIDRQSTSDKLRSHILERSKIFLHEYHSRSSEVRHDAKWLERNLKVQVVNSISLRRSLRGHSQSHTEKRSAAFQSDRASGYTLYVTVENQDSYQLSQALCSLMLERPNQSSYVLLESFLSLSLYQLRSRGYNVERILRAKAAEARIAEEQQRKQYQMEQAQAKEAERLREAQHVEHELQHAVRPQTPTNPSQKALPEPPSTKGKSVDMPGAFGSDSPENSPDQRPNNVRNLFSRFTKRFGNNVQNPLAPSPSNVNGDDCDMPPPYTDNPQRQIKAPRGDEEPVSSPAAIQRDLKSGIAQSRGYSSSTLNSHQYQDPKSMVKEAGTFCNSNVVHHLTSIGTLAHGTKVFIDKSLSDTASQWLVSYQVSLNAFEQILIDSASVYEIPQKAIHIFFDTKGTTIAFNQAGSLWANFRYWQQLHETGCLAGDSGGRVEALAYWVCQQFLFCYGSYRFTYGKQLLVGSLTPFYNSGSRLHMN